MDKENMKFREDARKSYNKLVRMLVSSIRKRDERIGRIEEENKRKVAEEEEKRILKR
jgi:hypothetical protein